MAPLPKYPPASERSSSSAYRPSHSAVTAYSQPYLLAGKSKRSVTPEQRYLPLFPHESEDARLTGSTRSLYRRVLGLNVTATMTHMQVSSPSSFVPSKIA
jgi:hypothetical protein